VTLSSHDEYNPFFNASQPVPLSRSQLFTRLAEEASVNVLFYVIKGSVTPASRAICTVVVPSKP